MADILDWQSEDLKHNPKSSPAAAAAAAHKKQDDAASAHPGKITTINGKTVILDKDGKP